MLDISLLRKDLPQVVARLETRKSPQPFLDVARFSALEGERKALQTRTEELQAKRNVLSREIGKLKGQGGDASAAMADVAAIGAELDRSAERLAAIQLDLNEQLMSLPNLPDASVPVGADEHANVEVRRWGVPREFAVRAARSRRRRRAARPRPRDRRQALGRPLLVPARAGGAAAPRARPVHARRADPGARLHRVLHAVHRQSRGPGGHRPAAQVQERHVLGLSRRRGRRRRCGARASST